MDKVCCVCDAPFIVGEVFRLTDEEMAVIGPTAEREVHYCHRCLKAIRNMQQGASILSGMFERNLAEAGVPGADVVAARFRASLLKAATRKLQ